MIYSRYYQPEILPKNRKIPVWIRGVITIFLALVCLLLLPMRLPGMVLLGISPNWVLIWVIVWCIKSERNLLQVISAGLVLGLMQDGMTHPEPTHALSLVIVAVLTFVLRKFKIIPQKLLSQDMITMALIVFVMSFVAESILTLQFWATGNYQFKDLWYFYQKLVLTSAILSSVWTPLIAFPLSRWGL